MEIASFTECCVPTLHWSESWAVHKNPVCQPHKAHTLFLPIVLCNAFSPSVGGVTQSSGDRTTACVLEKMRQGCSFKEVLGTFVSENGLNCIIEEYC